MVRNGDQIVITNRDHHGYNKTMEVINDNGIVDYYEYIGEHIIAKDESGKTHAIKDGDYLAAHAFDNVKSVNNIRVTDLITPNKRTNGTKKLFYPVTNVYENYISFIDDEGFKRSVPNSSVTKVDPNKVLDYINDLQQQIHNLREVTANLFNLIKDDIHNSLSNLNE